MMPVEHRGFVERRLWYKVKWVKNPHPEKPGWTGIEGKFDLMTENDIEEFKGFIQIDKSFYIPKCESGPSLRFGITTEDKIDDWINKHHAGAKKA